MNANVRWYDCKMSLTPCQLVELIRVIVAIRRALENHLRVFHIEKLSQISFKVFPLTTAHAKLN